MTLPLKLLLSSTAAIILITTAQASDMPVLPLQGSWSLTGELVNNVVQCDLVNQADPLPVVTGVNWGEPSCFHMYYGLGSGHVTFAVNNPGSPALRPGAPISVIMRIGDTHPWVAAAFVADGSTIQWTSSIANLQLLDQQMHQASGNLVLSFPNSLTPDAAFPLEGSANAVEELSGCMAELGKRALENGGHGSATKPVYSSPTDIHLQ